LQFASVHILKELELCDKFLQSKNSKIFWMNACDPASLCALTLEGFNPKLPARLPGNRLCFRGTELVSVTLKNGKELQIFVPPEDPDILEILQYVKVSRTRVVNPERKIVIENINGETVTKSMYTSALIKLGFELLSEKLILW
jgi:ATP-dependent Lhr-like helicase